MKKKNLITKNANQETDQISVMSRLKNDLQV